MTQQLSKLEGDSWRAQAFRTLVDEHTDFFGEVTNYTLLGATDEQLGEFFGHTRETWLFWLKHSPELRAAVADGGLKADADVALAMKKRATGYEYKRQKVVIDKQGNGKVIDLTEHVPPDTSAGKFWLTNRSAKWSDKSEHQHVGKVDIDRHVTIEFVGVKQRELIDVTPSVVDP